MVAIPGREEMWKQRVAQWRASGLSQRAFAIEQGFPIRQVGYWVRRLSGATVSSALIPVQMALTGTGDAAIKLRNANGWTLMLSSEVKVAWLAELMRAL